MENIKNIEFNAKQVSHYIEDEVCVMAFATDESLTPNSHIILSQTLFDDDNEFEEYQLEVKHKEIDIDTIGGINSISIRNNKIVLKIEKGIISNTPYAITIKTEKEINAELIGHLKLIIKGSNAELAIE